MYFWGKSVLAYAWTGGQKLYLAKNWEQGPRARLITISEKELISQYFAFSTRFSKDIDDDFIRNT